MGISTLVRRSSGYETLDATPPPEKTEITAENMYDPFRFWLKEGESTNVVFLDDDPWAVREHNIKLDGKFGNTFTCLDEAGQKCPLCAAGDKPALTLFWTVMIHGEVSGKNGKVYKNPLRILAAKDATARMLKKWSAKKGGLIGLEFEVERSKGGQRKVAAVGDSWMPDEKHSEKAILKLLGDDQTLTVRTPDNLNGVLVQWERYLAPKPAKELAKLVKTTEEAAHKDDDETDYD